MTIWCLPDNCLTITMKDNPQLSKPQEPGTSKLDWRYFEHNKVDSNELQVRKSLHKGTGKKWLKN